MKKSTLALAVAAALARCLDEPDGPSGWQKIRQGRAGLAWDAVLLTLLLGALFLAPLFALSGQYHVFGTDKVGQDVLYQVLKSVRTGLIIGLVEALAGSYIALQMAPSSVFAVLLIFMLFKPEGLLGGGARKA